MEIPAITLHFENENYLIAVKPSGTLSVPTRDVNETRPVLIHILRKQLNNGSLLPCHRLDFEVSGLILVAKNKKSHSVANTWFEKHQIGKTYHALSEGSAQICDNFRTPQILESLILRGKKRVFESPHGQLAKTKMKFLKTIPLNVNGTNIVENFFQWQLEPLTGRSHQLRYELYKIHCPIVGDHLYSSNYSTSPNAIALQATQLAFHNAPHALELGLPTHVEMPFQIPSEIHIKPATGKKI